MAVCAVFGVASIAVAAFAYRCWRDGRPLTHLSYDLGSYDGSLTDDEEAQWAEIEARLRSEDRTQ